MTYSYALGFGIQGLYFVFLARVLGAAQFGVWSGALAAAITASTLVGVGSGNVMVLNTARSPESFRTGFGTGLAYIGISAPFFIGLIWSLGTFVSAEFASVALWVAIAEAIGGRVIDLCLQAFQAHDRIKSVAHANVIVALTRFVLIVVAWATSGFALSVQNWSHYYAGGLLAIALGIFLYTRSLYGRPEFRKSSFKVTWKTSIYFALGMSSRMLYTDGDKYLLSALSTAAIAGQYSAGFRVVNMAFSPIQALVYSSNVLMFRSGKSGYQASWKVVRPLLLPSLGLSLIATAGLWLASPLLPVILGDGYSLSADALRIVSLLLVGQSVHYLFGDALMGLGRQKSRSLAQLGIGLISVAANIVLIPQYGWQSSAWVTVGSSFALAALTAAIYSRGLLAEKHRSQMARVAPLPDIGPAQLGADTG